jgi:sec-independent protein translocase protein TatA
MQPNASDSAWELMALVGYEWLIVVGILLVVFLWGPQKLPELARSIGLAKKEFEKAAKEVSTLTPSTPTSTSTPTTTPTTETPTDPLIVAAKSLGINTEGKTKEQIAKEIADKTTK